MIQQRPELIQRTVEMARILLGGRIQVEQKVGGGSGDTSGLSQP